MEDGKFWPPLIVLALLVGGIFAFRYFEKVDKARSALDTTILYLSQSQQSLETRKELWQHVEDAGKQLALALQHQQAVAKIQDDADKKQRLIEGDLKYLTKSMNSAVAKVRESAIGMEIPELKLVSGKVLKAARIRKVEDESISFFHSDGISAVPLEDIPSDLIERFDMGAGAVSKQLQQLEANLGYVPVESKNDNGVLQIKRRIAHLTVQIESTEKHKQKLEDEVSAYEARIKTEETRGNPTFSIRTMRDVAEGNAGRVRVELNVLKTELQKLNAELETLSKKK